MALYEVTGPDGTVYEVEGPPNATDQQVVGALRRHLEDERIQGLRDKSEELRRIAEETPAPQPERTFLGQAGEFVRGVPRGFIGTFGTAAEGAAALLPTEAEEAVVRRTRELTQYLSPQVKEGYEDGVPGKLGEALGSVFSFIVPGGAAGALARGAGAGITGMRAAQLGTVGVLGSATGAGEARIRAKQEEATPEEIAKATAWGIAPGLFEIIPAQRIFSRFFGSATKGLDAIPDTMKARMLQRVKDIALTAGTEAAQEAAQEFAQNLIAQQIYKPDQDLLEDLGESAAYGGAAGAMAEVILNMALGRRTRAPATAKDKEPTPDDLIREATKDLDETGTTIVTDSAPGIDIAYPVETAQDTGVLTQEAADLAGQDFADTDIADGAPRPAVLSEEVQQQLLSLLPPNLSGQSLETAARQIVEQNLEGLPSNIKDAAVEALVESYAAATGAVTPTPTPEVTPEAAPEAATEVAPETAPDLSTREGYLAETRRLLGDLKRGDIIENGFGDTFVVADVIRNKSGEITAIISEADPTIPGSKPGSIDIDGLGSLLLPSPYIDAEGNRRLSEPGKITRATPDVTADTAETVTPTPAPARFGYRAPSEQESSMFGSTRAIDFGPGNAQIDYSSGTIFISRPDGGRLGGPSDDAIIRPGDNRSNVIKKPDDFPDWVPNDIRQPLIDLADVMAKRAKDFPNTREGRQQLDAAIQNLPVAKRINDALSNLSRPDVARPELVSQPVPEQVQGLPEGAILQNRERSSPASIAQMNSIANDPDYSRVGFSNSFLEGAPVVFGPTAIPAAQLGRTGQIVPSKTKRKIPVQYAVIEAGDAIPSNRVDGTTVPEYADPSFPGFKAVTNGRLAGLQEGYRRNTMDQYKQDLMADDIHGIDPAVIAAMQNPVLVRVMPQNLVTRDIADESNTASALSLSAVERAKNDANRVSLEGLVFGEDGSISPETVRGFIASMPQVEQQELIDSQGRPTRQAYDRLNAAIFSRAYQSDALINLASQAQDSEARNIINALSQAAPQMAVLPEGAYDIRPAVIEATELAINARRQGRKLTDAIAQQDLVSQDPVARTIVQLYADNPRSSRKIGDGLKRIANAVNAEANRSLEPDMFGEVPARRPVDEVVIEAAVEAKAEGDLFDDTSTEVQISPEQEKAEALAEFQQSLNQAIPPYQARYPNGRVYSIRPKALTQNQSQLLLELAVSAIDLGMPASLLRKITAAGSTSSKDIAALSTPRGWLTIGKQWPSTSKAEKLETLIHELAHAADYDSTQNPTLSNTEAWASAHSELEGWYKSKPEKHPLRYPFAPFFAKKVRLREESFAQAFSLYFTSPVDLQSNAPIAYSQIDAIIKGIQNESRPTQRTSAQARRAAAVDVQRQGAPTSPAVQPQVSTISPSISRDAIGGDRAAGAVVGAQSPQTQEFRTWFGDSKVVDADGNPLVVYHGTNIESNFETFKTKDAGAWFAVDPYIAEGYTRRDGADLGRVMPVYLSIKNPLVIPEDIDLSRPSTVEDAINRINDENATTFEPSDLNLPESLERNAYEYLSSDQFVALLRRNGFDGIQAFENGYLTWNAFNPNQIKSVFNQRPTDDPSIIADINPGYRATGVVRDANDVKALNEDIRESKIREYQALKQRLSAMQRRRVEGEPRVTDNVMERALFRQAADLRDSIRATKPRRDTAEDFMARAAKALADGDISREVYDVVDDMFKKNPDFLEGLRLSVKASENWATAQFLPVARMIRLFKGTSGVMDPATIRHEFTHSMEQMMTPEVREMIVNKWRDSLAKAQKTDKSEQAQKYFDAVLKFLENPNNQTQNEAIRQLPDYSYYQYLNPSEYWAVNAEPLLGSYLGGRWQRFKMSMRGLLESIKKVLGLDSKNEIYSAFRQTINGKNRDITTLNSYIQSVAPMYQIQHRNYLGNPAPAPTWEMPPENTSWSVWNPLAKTTTRFNIVDKFVDLSDAQKAIEKNSKKIDDNFDALAKETLYHGKVARLDEQFLRTEVDPLLKELIKEKITTQELSAYALALHAPERNRRIAEINPRFPDGGSGITTAQAQAYIARLPQEKRQKLEALNKKLRDIIQETQDLEVKYGLTDESTVNNGREIYPNYVPLFREEVDYARGGSGLGQGLDVRGETSKRAVGSSASVKDVVLGVIEQRQRAIVRGEKAQIGKALYALSIANPNPDFWLPINPQAIKDQQALAEEMTRYGLDPQDAENIMQAPKVPQVVRLKDPVTGEYYEQVQYVVSPSANFSDNVISTRVNGQNRYVIFNPNNERAYRLARAFKNLETEQLGYMLQRVGNVTRWIASMSTQYNPIFGLWNFTRDLQGAALNLSTTPLKGQQARVLSESFKMLPQMYKEYRAARRGEQATGEYAELLRRFRAAGAQTGYRDQFTKMENNGNVLKAQLDRLNAGTVRKTVNAVAGWLSDYNDTLENAVRLSAFKLATSKEFGLSDQQAAVLAKNLTVNFNRKGAKTPGMSALYAFFNAAVQGIDRMMVTLRGPAGRSIIAGGMMLGSLQALILHSLDFGEDEPNEFIKQKNLIIPTGNGGYVMWPMPLGFNFLPNMGRILTEMTLDGRTKARDRVLNLMEVMADAFNPLGGAGFLQTISPTVLDPFVAVGQNMDAFGRPISREDMASDPKPGYLRSRENASEFAKIFSEILNSMSGGSEFTPGIVSPTADEIDYVIGQYLGGVGRELQRVYSLGKSQMTGEEVEMYRVPILGKLYGETSSPAAIASNFYRTANRMAEHEAEIKGRMEQGRSSQSYLEQNPEARMYPAANRIENEVRRINKTIRELRRQDRSDPRIKLLEERRTAIMTDFLNRLNELYPNR